MNKSTKDYNFVCHRKEDTNKKVVTVWAINGFAFNTSYGTFCSYGADGIYTTWDKDEKQKLRSSGDFGMPIVAADFSEDGVFLAYAIGYDWNKGAEGLKEK
jgi:mRNA export factor